MVSIAFEVLVESLALFQICVFNDPQIPREARVRPILWLQVFKNAQKGGAF